MGLLIANPNPVFDRTITVTELVLGAVMRALEVELTAGGKGINVARVLRTLGHQAPLLVAVGAEDAPRYCRLLNEEGADSIAVEVPGSVRIASIYREHATGRVTVVNDAGDTMSPSAWQHVHDSIVGRATTGDIVLCMGSFPPGVSPDAVRDLILGIRATGAQVLIDTAPYWLAGALEARPDVVTPNLHEAEAVLHTGSIDIMDDTLSAAQTRDRAMAAATALCARGAAHAIVTAGAAGVAIADEHGPRWHDAFPITPVSTVGAGDSFVAGLAIEWARTETPDWDEAVRFGIATSAASCEQVRAGGVDPERVQAIHEALLAREGAAA